MEKFNASEFRTTPDNTPRQRFKYEVEDILHHIRNLKPVLRVGWVRERPHILAVAVDRETIGCMTVISTASWEEREPYRNIDVAVYPDLSLQDVIDSWGAGDNVASANAAYPGSIAMGCEWLGWIVEPSDDEVWDSYI